MPLARITASLRSAPHCEHHVLVQISHVVEVLVEASPGDARPSYDSVDAGRFEGRCGELVDGGIDDARFFRKRPRCSCVGEWWKNRFSGAKPLSLGWKNCDRRESEKVMESSCTA